ncbi:MAG: DUF2156 domain-containing protein [Proteobacteria bacterium]|nr:DUF2156 domain-containing protein [Pseudomonadota bacterium]
MFKPLMPQDYSRLLPYFDHQIHRLCYYSLSAFICWNSPFSHPVWTIDDNLLLIGIRNTNDSTKDYLYLPIAQGQYVSPSRLHELAKKHGFNHFHLVPGEYVNAQSPEELSRWFHISEDIELADYIYQTQDLATLNGKKYSKKRNLINQFLKTHVDLNRVTIHDFRQNDIPECLAFLDYWTEDRDIESSDNPWAMMEYHATKNAIETIERLGYRGAVLRIDGEVKAFGLGSTLTSDLGGYHFEKADSYIKGLYQYFDQQCVRRLFPDLPFINKECDMGEPGLRHSKRSYYPVDYIRAFELKPL